MTTFNLHEDYFLRANFLSNTDSSWSLTSAFFESYEDAINNRPPIYFITLDREANVLKESDIDDVTKAAILKRWPHAQLVDEIIEDMMQSVDDFELLFKSDELGTCVFYEDDCETER